jgi:hypothetical protein
MAKDGVVYHIWCISISESIIDSIDKLQISRLHSAQSADQTKCQRVRQRQFFLKCIVN